jgi:hypothetical protein
VTSLYYFRKEEDEENKMISIMCQTDNYIESWVELKEEERKGKRK